MGKNLDVIPARRSSESLFWEPESRREREREKREIKIRGRKEPFIRRRAKESPFLCSNTSCLVPLSPPLHTKPARHHRRSTFSPSPSRCLGEPRWKKSNFFLDVARLSVCVHFFRNSGTSLPFLIPVQKMQRPSAANSRPSR